MQDLPVPSWALAAVWILRESIPLLVREFRRRRRVHGPHSKKTEPPPRDELPTPDYSGEQQLAGLASRSELVELRSELQDRCDDLARRIEILSRELERRDAKTP